MKRLFAASAAVLIIYFVLSVLPLNNEMNIYDDTVRLHVVANSDGEYDQSLKLFVRDRVLDLVSRIVDGAADADEAANRIADAQCEVADAAIAAVRDYGAEQSVSVSFGLEDYPTRYYDGFSLPAGEYRSLIVTLGEGDGHNWWCVLFPRLCSSVCVADKETCLDDGYSEAEYDMISKESGLKYRIRFRIVELFEKLF